MSSGVEFDEDKISYGIRPSPNSVTSSNVGGYSENPTNERGMAGWLIKKGLANTPGAAQGILTTVVIVNIIITFIVISYLL